MNLTPEERELVEGMQKDLANAKAALKDCMKSASQMMKIQYKAGRTREGNSLLRLRGELAIALGRVDRGHSDASDALCDCFEDGGDIVILGGGGR